MSDCPNRCPEAIAAKLLENPELAHEVWKILQARRRPSAPEDRCGGLSDARQLAGPLLATASGERLRQGHLWELVRRLDRDAGIEAWDQLSPHCLRHSAITFALDAGAGTPRCAGLGGHKDPRTTRRYDHARDSLDRNAAYAVSAYLA